MKFELLPSNNFLKQLSEFDISERGRIKEKLLLAEQNPFRNKAIHSKEFNHVFRIRITLQDREKRIIYVVLKDKVLVVGILDRDKDYKDLEAYLRKAKEGGI
jgi:mRNA-degrading endonuclease RelE of RelBE toxin-antitoxin system